jgi:hypothetical protein
MLIRSIPKRSASYPKVIEARVATFKTSLRAWQANYKKAQVIPGTAVEEPHRLKAPASPCAVAGLQEESACSVS